MTWGHRGEMVSTGVQAFQQYPHIHDIEMQLTILAGSTVKETM